MIGLLGLLFGCLFRVGCSCLCLLLVFWLLLCLWLDAYLCLCLDCGRLLARVWILHVIDMCYCAVWRCFVVWMGSVFVVVVGLLFALLLASVCL